MYRNRIPGIVKHGDFLLLDAVMISVSFFLAYYFRFRTQNLLQDTNYLVKLIEALILHFVMGLLFHNYRDILKHGFFIEAWRVFTHATATICVLITLSFIQHHVFDISRLMMLAFYVFSMVLMYAERLLWKIKLRHFPGKPADRKIILVSGKEEIGMFLSHLSKNWRQEFQIPGIISENTGKDVMYDGIRSVADSLEDAIRFLEKEVVDEILIVSGQTVSYTEELIRCAETMGIIVHYVINVDEREGRNHTVEEVGGIPVVSSCIRLVAPEEYLLKRVMDIFGSLIGLCMTGICFLFVAPLIFIAEPGPVFYSQIRIGENGRPFKMYKFRSMYKDAESRKKDLMEKNKIHGQMFKVDNDPRILGSGKNGKRKGIGWFLRRTSIDEFPQFWNVLKGDMSLVGTRPPTSEEWEQYEPQHRKRLRVRPGITGMWQISGRSTITDFNEVVQLDREYIEKWTLLLDLKIIAKTVWIILTGYGAE